MSTEASAKVEAAGGFRKPRSGNVKFDNGMLGCAARDNDLNPLVLSLSTALRQLCDRGHGQLNESNIIEVARRQMQC